MIDFVESIRHQYKECVTTSCKEKKCGLWLDGMPKHALAIIHGTRYQRLNSFTEKLCDRIIFCSLADCFIAAVELKSGNTIHLSDAISQIQNGLKIASDLLQGHSVGNWFPLLMYSGHLGPMEIKLLQTKRVEFRGNRKNVIKRDCNSEIGPLLSV